MKFTFFMPTRVVVGTDCLREQGQHLASLGSRVFIMTGKSSAVANGSLADLKAVVEGLGLKSMVWNKVSPNPSLEEVRAAAQEARDFGSDCVVAIGGGSPMDAAKAVAVLAAGTSAVSDAELLGQRRFAAVLPLAVIPTTAGTGSEVTPYSILTNDSIQSKSFLNSEQVFPRVAYLDGKYTEALPANITAATAVDAMSHSLEGYLAVRATPMSQCLALESLSLLGPQLLALAAGSKLDSSARESLLYASMLAGIVIAQSGTTAVHAMGYSLTYFKGLDHGVANGLLIPAYLRYLQPSRGGEIEKIVQALGMKSIEVLASTLSSLVGETQLSEEEIEKFSSLAIQAGNIQNTNPKPLKQDLVEMLGTYKKK